MQTLNIGDVTITSIIERDGPWRKPEDMFPAYDPAARPAASRRDGPRGVRSRLGQDGHHLPDLRRAHAQAHGPDRYLHRRGQGPSAADGFSQAAVARQLSRRRA